jgi:hypothetical protein
MNISALGHLNCGECLVASAAYAITAPVSNSVISVGSGSATNTSELSLRRPLLCQRKTLTEHLPLPQVYQINSEPSHTRTVHACSASSLSTDPEKLAVPPRECTQVWLAPIEPIRFQ